MGRLHGIEELSVFGRFHGDLGKENRVGRQLGQPPHEFKALCPDGLKFIEPVRVVLLLGQAEVGESHGIKIVVGERDEAKSQSPQLDDFLDYHIRGTLAGTLTVGPPNRAEGAMLGAAPNRLHRGPHVALARHQVPAGGQERVGFNAAAFVDRQRRSLGAIRQYPGPDHISIALDYRVSATQFVGFVGIEGGVNASEHHVGAALAGHFPDFVAAERVGGVDADADNIAGLNLIRVYRLQGLVDQAGIAKARRCRRCKHIQPARGNDRGAKRNFTGIDEVNAHAMSPSLGGLAKAVEQLAPGTTISDCLERCTAQQFGSHR